MAKIDLTSSFSQDILDEFSKYNLVQDRLAGDVLTLPYDFYDIKIKVNDFAVSETINYSLERIYENSLYILSKSVIPSNNIPETRYYEYIVNDTGSGPEWRPYTDFPATQGACQGQSLSGIKNFLKVNNVADVNNYNVIATTSTNLMILSGTSTSSLDKILNPDIPSIVSDSNITHPSNGVFFQNITDITISESNNLYVMDSDLKTIFKFDISGALTLDDAVLKNDTPGRLMIGMVGGPGGLSDKTKFNHPMSMTSVNNLLYVIDYDQPTDTSAIKVYDSQLNWKKTQNVGKSLSGGPVDIKYCERTEELFVLCHRPTTLADLGVTTTLVSADYMPELVSFDLDTLSHTSSYRFFDESKHGSDIGTESFRSLNFSKENTNIFYILSDQNMYKKYVSRPTDFVGKFLIAEKHIGTEGSPPMDFRDFSIQETTLTSTDPRTGDIYKETRDELIIYDEEYETFHKFLEESNYEKSLQSDIESNFMIFPELEVHPDELVSSLVYNKAFIKSLYNNVLILENISRRFTTVYDNNGISRYIGFTYLIESELKKLTYKQTMNNLLGVNEPVLTSTINRCLQEIYDLQQKILSLIQEKSINVYPLTTAPIILT